MISIHVKNSQAVFAWLGREVYKTPKDQTEWLRNIRITIVLAALCTFLVAGGATSFAEEDVL